MTDNWQDSASVFMDYWRGLPSQDLVPEKTDLRPEDIKELLPRISIHERTGSNKFIYRLHGAGLAARSKADNTGRDLFAITPPEWRSAVCLLMNAILDQPCGVVERHLLADPLAGDIYRMGIHLPMAESGSAKFIVNFYPDMGDDAVNFTSSRRPEVIRQPIAMTDVEFIDIGAGKPDFAADAEAKIQEISAALIRQRNA